MAASDPAGTNWTGEENDLIIASYFAMLGKELAGEPYVKTEQNAELQRLTRRSRGSIERKNQNISAVLRKLGLPWIFGYKPLPNYQSTLIAGVDRYLSSMGALPLPKFPFRETAEPHHLFIEPMPTLIRAEEAESPALRRLVSKFDPAARDARNRALGRRGEELALEFEQGRLCDAGRSDLARKVDWISESKGDGAGYDILSFTERGEERLLEVKTTMGYALTPFFLSANEHSLSEEQPKNFRIFRIYDVARDPRAFEIAPPLKDAINLRTANYRATFD